MNKQDLERLIPERLGSGNSEDDPFGFGRVIGYNEARKEIIDLLADKLEVRVDAKDIDIEVKIDEDYRGVKNFGYILHTTVQINKQRFYKKTRFLL